MDVSTDLHVVENRQLLEQADVLKRPSQTEGSDLVRLEHRGGNAADEDFPLGRLVHAGEHVEDGGLSRAIRTDQADQLARTDGKVEFRHRGQTSEPDGHVARVEERGVGIRHHWIGGEASPLILSSPSPSSRFSVGIRFFRLPKICHNSRRPSSPCGRVSMSAMSMIE